MNACLYHICLRGRALACVAGVKCQLLLGERGEGVVIRLLRELLFIPTYNEAAAPINLAIPIHQYGSLPTVCSLLILDTILTSC